MKRKISGKVAGALVAVAAVFPPVPARAAEVDVYAEGAYTSGDLVVYIYTDINTEPLVSAAVKLTYDPTRFYPVDAASDPVDSAPVAARNETVWYFGSAAGVRYSYVEPEIDTTAGEVVFICGRIDESDPAAGVLGTRKLIGTVRFGRNENAAPAASPEEYFGVSLGLGIENAEGKYANFVTTGGRVLDSVTNGISYGMTIRKRGDANADGVITSSDYSTAKTLITNGTYKVFADCNADEVITSSDYFCIKSLM